MTMAEVTEKAAIIPLPSTERRYPIEVGAKLGLGRSEARLFKMMVAGQLVSPEVVGGECKELLEHVQLGLIHSVMEVSLNRMGHTINWDHKVLTWSLKGSDFPVFTDADLRAALICMWTYGQSPAKFFVRLIGEWIPDTHAAPSDRSVDQLPGHRMSNEKPTKEE